MKMKFYVLILVEMMLSIFQSVGQNKDKAIFREVKPGFIQSCVLKDDPIEKGKNDPETVIKEFQLDLSGLTLPNKVDLYKNQQWRNPPESQGNTGICWCYAATSLLESETYRIHHKEVRLSEIFTVYWEYVEKTRRFIRERGNSVFAEGSELNAVTRIWKKYGVVPADAYSGLLNGRKYHNHEKMYGEMNNFLESMKAANAWDEEAAVSTIRSIMNYYMGVPPSEVVISGVKITPLEYLNQVLKINPDDYVNILSYSQEPFWQKVEYKVPDNWWHSREYFNVPIVHFMPALKSAVSMGFTVGIACDYTESGICRTTQCAVVPDFDIPSAYINDDARQLRFSNQTTTDDHAMHLVGYLEKDRKDWYLIKDSGQGARDNDPNAKEFGYLFFSDDFIKLKTMCYMIHKDAVKDLLGKFNN